MPAVCACACVDQSVTYITAGAGLLRLDIVEAHCYFVDIGRTDREQNCSVRS